MSSVAKMILNRKEKTARSAHEIAKKRFWKFIPKVRATTKVRLPGDLLYAKGIERDQLSRKEIKAANKNLFVKDCFDYIDEISAVENLHNYTIYDHSVLNDMLNGFVSGYMSLAYSVLLYRVKRTLYKSLDLSYFESYIDKKFEVLQALGQLRIYEYLSLYPDGKTGNNVANLVSCQIFNIAFIIAEAEKLYKKNEVGSKNGRFVFQYIVDRMSLYLYRWGKYSGGIIVGIDFNPKTAEECSEIVEEMFEDILEANSSIQGLNFR